MTRFDDPPAAGRGRLFGAAVHLLAANAAVFTVAIVCATVAIWLAGLALVALDVVGAQWSAGTAGIRLSVFMTTAATRGEAAALESRIDALPEVGRATLRLREDALASMATSGLPALSIRPNPLPDVWLVSLRPSAWDQVRSQKERVDALRTALSGLPGVESVRVDERWVGRLDGWAPLLRRAVPVATAGAVVFAVVAAFALFFLAGRASASGNDAGPVRGATAIAGLLGGLLACGAGALLWTAALWPTGFFDVAGKPHPGTNGLSWIVVTGGAIGILLVCSGAGWLADRRKPSARSND